MRSVLRLALAACLSLAPAVAAARPGPAPPARVEAVDEASRLYGLPREWLDLVITAESGGDPDAVSPAGARGLMQLMPQTWAELRGRLGLGPNPFDVRDNVLAGAGYLREMLDRFGAPGFLAAYHAGPARYARYLAGEGRLGPATAAYVLRLAPGLSDRRTPAPAPRSWRAAPLFPMMAARADPTQSPLPLSPVDAASARTPWTTPRPEGLPPIHYGGLCCQLTSPRAAHADTAPH